MSSTEPSTQTKFRMLIAQIKEISNSLAENGIGSYIKGTAPSNRLKVLVHDLFLLVEALEETVNEVSLGSSPNSE